MNTTRIIARLDIKGPNLVKGVHLEGLRVMGDPKVFAEEYYNDGIDEMIYMDTVASLYGRNSLLEFVNATAGSIFIPLTVGGGIRAVTDVSALLQAGADKVAINTAAIKNPELIREASKRFGSQCIVVSIEAKRVAPYQYECFTDNGREPTGVNVLEWAKHVEQLGAGEILLTSIDFEGTGSGFDLELTKLVAEAVAIPVIASGGCGRHDHVAQVLLEAKADAVAIASVFHYEKIKALIEHHSNKDYTEGNLNYIEDYLAGHASGRRNITPASILEIKKYLNEKKIPIRL